jgi:hypothetical protein
VPQRPVSLTGLVLALPVKPDVERDAVARAWPQAGRAVIRLDRFWEPPELPAERVRVYGPVTFAVVVAEVLGLELVGPPNDLLVDLPRWATKTEATYEGETTPGAAAFVSSVMDGAGLLRPAALATRVRSLPTPDAVASVRWCSRSMASRTASLQLGRLSATLAWNGGTVMAGPLMVSWRFDCVNPSPRNPVFEPRRVEERVEWRVELPLVDVAVAERDAGEDRRVELSLGGVAGPAAGGARSHTERSIVHVTPGRRRGIRRVFAGGPGGFVSVRGLGALYERVTAGRAGLDGGRILVRGRRFGTKDVEYAGW